MSNRRGDRGFSLAELLLSVALVSVLTSASVHYFPELRGSFVRNQTSQILMADIRRARSEAASSGGRSVILISATGKSYSVGVDLEPYASPAAADTTLFQRALPSGLSLTASQTVTFDPRGYLINSSGNPTNIALTLFDHSNDFLSLTIYPTGYMQSTSVW